LRFKLAFQPIFNLETNEVIGYEALARFPDGGPPEAHLALLAQSGEKALRAFDALSAAMAAGAARARGLLPGQRLFINVTAATARAVLAGEEWPRTPSGIPVVWELPEDRDGDGAGLSADEVAALLRTGAEVALDDLGGGFAEVLRFAAALDSDDARPPWCKLARRVTAEAPRSSGICRLLRRLTQLLPIIAEGIETPAERDALLRAGVRYAQGFLLGPPGPLPPAA